jgi:hypothetical protein
MAEAVYILCAVTSVAIAILLFRGYARSRARFLMWCALCFVGLAINNALLFVDKVLFPDVDLQFAGISTPVWRGLAALVGLLLLIWGLIWDSDGQ